MKVVFSITLNVNLFPGPIKGTCNLEYAKNLGTVISNAAPSNAKFSNIIF